MCRKVWPCVVARFAVASLMRQPHDLVTVRKLSHSTHVLVPHVQTQFQRDLPPREFAALPTTVRRPNVWPVMSTTLTSDPTRIQQGG